MFLSKAGFAQYEQHKTHDPIACLVMNVTLLALTKSWHGVIYLPCAELSGSSSSFFPRKFIFCFRFNQLLRRTLRRRSQSQYWVWTKLGRRVSYADVFTTDMSSNTHQLLRKCTKEKFCTMGIKSISIFTRWVGNVFFCDKYCYEKPIQIHYLQLSKKL